MKVRNLVFWLHLVVGLTAGAVILFMVVTGLMISFQRQVVTWAESSYAVQPGTTPLGPEALVAKVQEAQPKLRPTALTYYADSTKAVLLVAGRDKSLLLNPHTGAVMGEAKVRTFFQLVQRLHMEFASGKTGKAVTGAASAAFGVLWVSGLCLWWPRSWKKSAVKSSFVFGRGLSGKARDWNWHNVIGLWASLPLLITILTGLVMSYAWANNLLFRLSGNEPPAQRKQENKQPRDLELEGLDDLWPRAVKQVADWQSITVRLPTSAEAPVTFLIDRGDGSLPHLRSQLTLERETGDIEKWETFASYNLGRKPRTWVKPVHTGEWGGIVGQTIAALATLGAGVLVYTGFALAWRRFFSPKPKT